MGYLAMQNAPASPHRSSPRGGAVATSEIPDNSRVRDKAMIDQYKRNSPIAAKELCWEAESLNFVFALTALVDAKA
jgi:hypothetical protein